MNHTPPSTFNCPICQEQFPNENARFNHLSNDQCQCHHQLPEMLKTSCLICQRDLLTVSFYYCKKTINIFILPFWLGFLYFILVYRVVFFVQYVITIRSISNIFILSRLQKLGMSWLEKIKVSSYN